MKKTTIFVLFLALSVSFAEEEAKKGKKRGVFGESLGLGHGGFDLGHGSELGFEHGSAGGQDFGSSFGSEHGFGSGQSFGGASSHGPIDLGSTVHKHYTITKKIGHPVPQPYPVHVEKKIPVPVPHPVPYPVDKPYTVHVPKPYPVPVDKPVPYNVYKQVPYPVKYPVKVPYKVPVAVPYPQPYPVTVHKSVPVQVPEPYIVKKPVPVIIKSHDSHGFQDNSNGLGGLGGLGGFGGHGLSLGGGHEGFGHGSSYGHHF